MIRYGVLLGTLALTGCMSVKVDHPGPTQHDSVSFDKGNADVIRATLKMGAGKMRVGPGSADKLVRADFDYSVPSWKPEVEFNSGTLRISQPEGRGATLGNNTYEWNLRVNPDTPLELTINFGAGEAHLDLGRLTLRRVALDMGVGQVDMDLTGTPQHSYDVRVHGGVGEATIRLPSGVGVEANVRGGIGDISARGMRQDGSMYYNDAYKKSPVTVHLDVEG